MMSLILTEKLEGYLKEYDKKLDEIIGILNASQFDR